MSALIFRRTARLAVITLLVLVLLQTADHDLTALVFGFFPFSAIPIDFPLLLTALFTLAILDER